jgi:hypothetical protein
MRLRIGQTNDVTNDQRPSLNLIHRLDLQRRAPDQQMGSRPLGAPRTDAEISVDLARPVDRGATRRICRARLLPDAGIRLGGRPSGCDHDSGCSPLSTLLASVRSTR